MRLKSVDKIRYRKHLNVITVISILCLIAISLGSSTLLILWLSDGEGSNFFLNLAGVVMGCLLVGFTLHKLRNHPYFAEVTYIWDLKQELNRIQRKMKKLEDAVSQHNPTAMLILAFSYEGSALIWELDNNTLMMSELNIARNKLQQQAEAADIELNTDDYHRELLKQF